MNRIKSIEECSENYRHVCTVSSENFSVLRSGVLAGAGPDCGRLVACGGWWVGCRASGVVFQIEDQRCIYCT